MAELFNSSDLQLVPRQDQVLREEIFVSVRDAERAGLGISDQYCVFGIQPLMPGPKDEEFAARIRVSSEVNPGKLQINQLFLEYIGFLSEEKPFWYIRSAPKVIQVQNLVVEHSLEQENIGKEIESLNYQKEALFEGRCLLVESSRNNLSLRVPGRGNFYIRNIDPAMSTLREKSIIVIGKSTQIGLFVPHRKSGVDMVVVVDGSESMDLRDFFHNGYPHSRLRGVRVALELLFKMKLASGSRVASMAMVAFGNNVKMLYPSKFEMRRIVGKEQLGTIRESINHVNITGLQKIGIDRDGTDISKALKWASDLLDAYSQENNERIIILLSDGANWSEDKDGRSIDEVMPTSSDPAILAGSIKRDSKIRIHTIAISDETTYNAYLRHHPKEPRRNGYIPNKDLLRIIAESTDGLFLESPSADLLAHILAELGEGITYQIS